MIMMPKPVPSCAPSTKPNSNKLTKVVVAAATMEMAVVVLLHLEAEVVVDEVNKGP